MKAKLSYKTRDESQEDNHGLRFFCLMQLEGNLDISDTTNYFLKLANRCTKQYCNKVIIS